MKRGLKDPRINPLDQLVRERVGLGYNLFPDEKGTERP